MAFTLTWNESANKFYESGVDRGVLFLQAANGTYPTGVAWEGLISVTEKPSGAEPTDLFANNTKYAQLISAETFEGTIEAYTFPDEFLACDGVEEVVAGMFAAQQGRTKFGLAYRTYVGSDAAGQMADYKIHVIYGGNAQPSEVSRTTINDSPEAATFSWDFTTTPVSMTGFNPVSKLVFDSRTLPAAQLTAIEEALYGDGGVGTPSLPLPDALVTLATP